MHCTQFNVFDWIVNNYCVWPNLKHAIDMEWWNHLRVFQNLSMNYVVYTLPHAGFHRPSDSATIRLLIGRIIWEWKSSNECSSHSLKSEMSKVSKFELVSESVELQQDNHQFLFRYQTVQVLVAADGFNLFPENLRSWRSREWFN